MRAQTTPLLTAHVQPSCAEPGVYHSIPCTWEKDDGLVWNHIWHQFYCTNLVLHWWIYRERTYVNLKVQKSKTKIIHDIPSRWVLLGTHQTVVHSWRNQFLFWPIRDKRSIFEPLSERNYANCLRLHRFLLVDGGKNMGTFTWVFEIYISWFCLSKQGHVKRHLSDFLRNIVTHQVTTGHIFLFLNVYISVWNILLLW